MRLVATVTVAATAVNVGFWLLPTRRLLRKLAAGRPHERHPAPLSIVLAARNEVAGLPGTLRSLLVQQHPALEVVVCDDDSSDGTQGVLAQAAVHDAGRLRHVEVGAKKRPGKKQALATAIRHARADWLLATDADCQPAGPHWAATMQAAAGPYDEFVLGYSPYRRRAGGGWLDRWIRFEACYTAIQYLSAALMGRPYMGVGRNLLYARRAYERAGGFADHAHLAGGDDDLLVNAVARAHNTAVCVHREAWTYSAPHRGWRAYARQKRRHLSVATSYRRGDRVWLGALAASHVTHFAGVIALAAIGHPRWTLVTYGVRLAAIWSRGAALSTQLGSPDLSRLFPLGDIALAAYYLVGSLALLPGGDAEKRW